MDVAVVVARIGAVQGYWVEDQSVGLQEAQLALNQVGESRTAGYYRTDCSRGQHLGMHLAVGDSGAESSTN